MSARIEWEEWVVDYTGTVAGISGQRVVCGTAADRDAWLAANGKAAGTVVVSKRHCSQEIHAVYGIPSSPALPAAQVKAAPTAATAPQQTTVVRWGTPNVPPGFQP